MNKNMFAHVFMSLPVILSWSAYAELTQKIQRSSFCISSYSDMPSTLSICLIAAKQFIIIWIPDGCYRLKQSN